ncbi:MAG: hypothetical protein AAFQ22_07730 [Pseudomonadota bacterium]
MAGGNNKKGARVGDSFGGPTGTRALQKTIQQKWYQNSPKYKDGTNLNEFAEESFDIVDDEWQRRGRYGNKEDFEAGTALPDDGNRRRKVKRRMEEVANGIFPQHLVDVQAYANIIGIPVGLFLVLSRMCSKEIDLKTAGIKKQDISKILLDDLDKIIISIEECKKIALENADSGDCFVFDVKSKSSQYYACIDAIRRVSNAFNHVPAE